MGRGYLFLQEAVFSSGICTKFWEEVGFNPQKEGDMFHDGQMSGHGKNVKWTME